MYYSQRDPRWADVRLGTSRATIGGMGCLVTSLASVVSDVAGVETDPGRLNRWLARNGGFYGGNRLVFSAVEPLGLVAQVWDCHDRPAPMDLVAHVLEQRLGVLALVDFRPGGSVDQHWVRIAEQHDDDCLVVDPWLPPSDRYDGMHYWLMARYADPAWDGSERAIFRLVIYTPLPTETMRSWGTPVARVFRENHQERLCRRPTGIRGKIARWMRSW